MNKKRTIWAFALITAAALVLAFTGCDDLLNNNDNNENDPPVIGGTYTPGTYLLTTTWSQREPYNNQIPLYNGERLPTGCSMTATTQIMNYYKHPQGAMSGTIPAYTTATLGISLPETNINGVAFDWNNMKDSYPRNSYTDAEANAVATLMSVTGKASKVDYDVDGSSGSINTAAMIEYFQYTEGIRRLNRDEIGDNWETIIKEQIDSGMPVYYAAARDDGGAGHVFILDGYNDSGEFHVNWGWGGNSDGWYRTTALIPNNTTQSRNYNTNHRISINLMPANATSNSLSAALTIVEGATYTTTIGSAPNAAQAKARVTETVQALNLGAGVTFKVHDVGTSPYPFTTSSLGTANSVQEYKFVVSLTKDAVTFTSRILTLTLVNFAGGNGTAENPYQITNATQLGTLATIINLSPTSTSQSPIRAAYSDKHYILTGNINLSSYGNWTPIGSSAARSFSGVFDGNGKVITGLTIDTADTYQGLFGYIGGTVKNLGLEDVNISGGDYTGGIAASVGSTGNSSTDPYPGTISNCYTSGVITGKNYAGGITSRIVDSNSVIENCYSTVTINATERVGGIAGYITNATIKNCAALNQSIHGDLVGSTETDPRAYRVLGTFTNPYTLDNNIAFADMLFNGVTSSAGSTTRNGANITAADILADGTLGGRFTSPVWTTEPGKLPGFGQARSLPVYIQ